MPYLNTLEADYSAALSEALPSPRIECEQRYFGLSPRCRKDVPTMLRGDWDVEPLSSCDESAPEEAITDLSTRCQLHILKVKSHVDDDTTQDGEEADNEMDNGITLDVEAPVFPRLQRQQGSSSVQPNKMIPEDFGSVGMPFSSTERHPDSDSEASHQPDIDSPLLCEKYSAECRLMCDNTLNDQVGGGVACGVDSLDDDNQATGAQATSSTCSPSTDNSSQLTELRSIMRSQIAEATPSTGSPSTDVSSQLTELRSIMRSQIAEAPTSALKTEDGRETTDSSRSVTGNSDVSWTAPDEFQRPGEMKSAISAKPSWILNRLSVPYELEHSVLLSSENHKIPVETPLGFRQVNTLNPSAKAGKLPHRPKVVTATETNSPSGSIETKNSYFSNQSTAATESPLPRRISSDQYPGLYPSSPLRVSFGKVDDPPPNGTVTSPTRLRGGASTHSLGSFRSVGTHSSGTSLGSRSSCLSKGELVNRHHSLSGVMSKYETIRELGKGSFSHVFLVRERATGIERVCKQVNVAGLSPKLYEWLKMEIDLLRRLDHPHIVSLLEYAEDTALEMVIMILEYIPGADTGHAMRTGGSLLEVDVARYVRQTLLALAYCHSRGVSHRDVKPENMVLTMPGEGNPDIKLIDFGLASIVGVSSSHVDGALPLQNSCVCLGDTAADFVGTPPYMSPEILRHNCTDFSKADIWSLAVSAIELLTGQCPFGKLADSRADSIYQRILGFMHFSQVHNILQKNFAWRSVSSEAKDFIRLLLQPDPLARPTAAKLLQHPWLSGDDGKQPSLEPYMLRSMSEYSSTHPLLKAALLLLVARAGLPKEDGRIKDAFLSLDKDHKGEISYDSLSEAFELGAGWYIPTVPVDDAINAADLDSSGGLNYSEFVQACTYAERASQDDLLRLTFNALDEDQDGLVNHQDVVGIFRDQDLLWLRELPESFNYDDWRACVARMGNNDKCDRRGIARGRKPPRGPSRQQSTSLVGWLMPFLSCKMKSTQA